MARPQPTPALRKSRPESHAFEQVSAAAPAAEPVRAPEPAVPAAVPQRRNAATAASSNAAGKNDLVKLSVRVRPEVNRAIKRYGIESGLSFQQIAMVALREYLQREGHPLPDPEAG
ncbi:hypothetical protein [Trujillonella endophytica]|uniref:Uncharacterized protein n=1 Tax=Trujillonella endophytica TaxID=673521 RepID=A0A1H8WP74_9ACTN|nr:hypothetical protein [Trujillella endophytica]SEP29451.1 hypothetical protein SAMN05660991_04598 [Trujillella endophytica]